MMDKHLIVTFSDGSRWQIPAGFVATDRAAYYAKLDSERDGVDYDKVFGEEVEFALKNEFELIDWAKNNMDWVDVMGVAEKLDVKRAEHRHEWANADMKVVSG